MIGDNKEEGEELEEKMKSLRNGDTEFRFQEDNIKSFSQKSSQEDQKSERNCDEENPR